MSRLIRHCIMILLAFIIQVTLLPTYIADPFKPNLLLIVVVWLGLTAKPAWGIPLVYILGLAQDSCSGIYLGLNGFSFLLVFLGLQGIAHRLYTDNRLLMTLAVFIATIVSGLIQLLLLMLFSAAGGIYISLLSTILPHGFVNALMASLIFGYVELPTPEARS